MTYLRRIQVTLVVAMFGSALLLAPTARAIDDPHALSFNVRCSSCHTTHSAAGTNLSSASSNEALCLSCHTSASGNRFPTDGFMKADPTVGIGSSHAWNVPATNSEAGAQAPQSAAMTAGLDNGKIICSTCHNQHHSDPGAVTAGLAGMQTKNSVADHVAGSGTGTVTAAASASASAKTFLIEIVAPGAAGTATFRLSNDGGISWYGWSGAWVGYDVATAPARLTGSSVALNDGANVTVTFTGATAGSFTTGDRFRVGVSYPFLRVAMDSGDNVTGTKFCRDCHRDRAMDHTRINVWDGVTRMSHPVGVALNANGNGTDRIVPLDANGAPQSGGADQDGNPSNNLVLASDNTVQCLTCHAVHGADGNSNTQ